ncbi:MAG TPA: serine hydrolase domain-containing protein [Acidimicrobiales bacterium]|nr:serine hydrolase domain-containing protein [Acidimicrobiales bacterium]
MAEVHGTFDARFAGVRDALDWTLSEGLDVGASAAVFVDGEPVVDIWGGLADEAAGTPWERDTITNVWSTTKTMTALCALVLADRGEIDLHAPVARYWPEFKAAGKEAIEVRHLMSHSAGLSGWAEPLTVEDLYDWDKCTSLLAAQEPWWEPGTRSGYHAVTQGYLVGEVVRRVSGQSLGTFFATELARPLGADFHIGLPATQDARVSFVIPPPPVEASNVDLSPGSVAVRTFASLPLDATWPRARAWRGAEIPAANGHGNARSVALVQSVLACGGTVGGTRFMSAKGCDAVFEEQVRGTDLVIGLPLRFGIGYGLSSEASPAGLNDRSCYWGGWGGSLVVIDLEHRATIAYVMNKMGSGTVGDERGAAVLAAARSALEDG